MCQHKAIEDYESLCFKCLQKKSINTYRIYRNEYGSSFDNNNTCLQICEDCKPEGLENWFSEKPEIIDGYIADYKYEQNIIDFVKTFPIEGQELFWARCSSGACSTNMTGQDWIDYKLNILSHEKCKKYGYYSPQEKQAYKERFSTCQYPTNINYNDDSKGCWCPFGANGDYNQICGSNISEQCYKCKHYMIRTTPIKDIYDEDFDDYIVYVKSKLNKEKYEKKFGNL